MADVFEDNLSLVTERVRLWELIEATPHLDWLLLTKRPENADGMTPTAWRLRGWPGNAWAMTTAEDQQRADQRIPHLLRIPAKVRGISAEPLLGPLDLRPFFYVRCHDSYHGGFTTAPGGLIHWVIVGGESGHGARPMHPKWARSLRDQCDWGDVAFHFKQWGEWEPRQHDDGRPFDSLALHNRDRLVDTSGDVHCTQGAAGHGYACMSRVGKARAGRLLDGREWNEFPEVTHA